MKAAGDNILVSTDTSGIPVLMAKLIGNIPFVRQTTEHHSLISATMPDPHTSPNRASEKPLNQLDNRALEKPLKELLIRPLQN